MNPRTTTAPPGRCAVRTPADPPQPASALFTIASLPSQADARPAGSRAGHTAARSRHFLNDAEMMG